MTDLALAPGSISGSVLARARHCADQVAVRDATGAIDYAALSATVGAVADLLRERGIGAGDLVGVVASRHRLTPPSLLGVMASGAAYVPLEPTLPATRLRDIVANAGLSVVLVPDPADAPELGVESVTVHCPAVTSSTSSTAPALDAAGELAYVIFTSGSTGRPKGVQVTHDGVLNLLSHMAVHPGLRIGETALGVTTPGFDLSVPDLFLPLLVGATLVLAPREACSDGHALRQLVESVAPDLMQAVPSTWRLLLAAGWQGSPSLRIVCGGEAYEASLARELADRSAEVWNFYGPTETTVWSVAQSLDAEARDPLPMGYPIRGTTCRVCDDDGTDVAPGQIGELRIGGSGVARGYLDRADLTAAAFVPGPDGRIEFRTGDYVRAARDGRLTFVERRDGQIKLRGYRVELGDIETAASALDGIGRAIAVHVPEPVAAIVLYVTAPQGSPPGGDIEPLTVLTSLRDRLAPYMVPSLVVALQQFPLTGNGKVDRRALSADAADRLAARSAPSTAVEFDGTPIERAIAAVWSDVLGVAVRTVDDDFFALGGDSLSATRISGRLARQLGVTIGVSALFEAPTVAELAVAVVELLIERLDEGAGVETASLAALLDEGSA